MIEFASINDKKELSSLWQMTFLEDCQVIEYFFEHIFKDVVTPVIKIDGEIVSSLFLLPCSIGKFKGKCVYCAMTKYSHRGKGYMKDLLDFSYDYCKENGFDFLFLVPAETSLFDYYAKCGFEKFGIARTYTFDNTTPENREKLNYQYELEFDNSIIDYWKNSCVVYGGKIIDFGLVFDDEEITCITTMIERHSHKDVIDDEMCELLKDADMLTTYYTTLTYHDSERLQKLVKLK